MRSPRPGLDTPAGQEFEIAQNVVKSRLPVILIAFLCSQRLRDAQPGILNGVITHYSVLAETVFGVPDVLCNGGDEIGMFMVFRITPG